MTHVFLDANVLVPVVSTDLFLNAATIGLFTVCWSADVIDEAVATLQRIRPDTPTLSIRHRFDTMNNHFPDAEVPWNQPLSRSIALPDENDRHVIAATLAANADTIITRNIKDFPTSTLEPLGLRAAAPDPFMTDLLRSHPAEFTTVLTNMTALKKRPPLTTADILDALSRSGLPQFSQAMATQLAAD